MDRLMASSPLQQPQDGRHHLENVVDSTACLGHLSDDDELRRVTPLQTKKAMILQSPVCNFEAFSHFFHLPLKAAAEKFGVRATAFKKRCRSIGIRHWPYRKVRSLKRSLQELNRCKDNGLLNDKQHYQYETFKKQLDKLMSPETYGIDPSGQLLHAFMDDDDDMDSGDDMCSMDSPRYGGASFSDCSISPTDVEKAAFPDHFGSFDKQQLPPLRKPSNIYLPRTMNMASDMPALTLRMTAKDMANLPPISGSVSLESYFDRPLQSNTQTSLEVDPEDYMDDHTQNPTPLGDDIMLADIKYDDDDTFDSSEYHGDRFFDDVFLQISPDYGCLV
ncbi:hypothetical protein LEN26_015490 [Aphanomyces euteiches]|nr:hypothetical protein LEN26_015490 [Aphanomyces euteiches]KAH9120632.1 hypothetical protein AeMF1_007298 [Aphanomyces euteiches]KAH9187901.1 hypothetical protein AeNC1_010120 [Aphanomyces euteiches]